MCVCVYPCVRECGRKRERKRRKRDRKVENKEGESMQVCVSNRVMFCGEFRKSWKERRLHIKWFIFIIDFTNSSILSNTRLYYTLSVF